MKNLLTTTLVLFLLTLNVISCSSNNIKMLPELKTQKLDCDLYLSDLPNYSNVGAPGGIFYLTYTKYTLPKINEIYNTIDKNDLRNKFIKNLLENLNALPQNVKISNQNNIHYKLAIEKPNYKKEDFKNNPRLSNYDFTQVRKNLNTKYVFEIYMFQWGHFYSDSHYTFFNGVATIYDITNNTIAWRYYFNNKMGISALTLSGVGISTIEKDLVIESIDYNINAITKDIKDNLATEFQK